MSTAKPFERFGEGAGKTAIRWPLHVAFAISLAGFCALYAQTFESLISTWASTGRYQYAFLIVPVSAVLVWLRRDNLKQLAAVPAPLGLIPLVILCLIWLAGAATHINVATQFSIIAMIPCLVFAFYGTAITRALIFPLAYLFFALPVGNFLVGPLQDITAQLSVAALQWTPVPVFLNGRYIMTPEGTWHVAEACSGVSFFFATTAFGVLYANLFFQSWRRRLLFVALALITPIIANGLRVFFTILIGEYFGMQYATGTDHMIFGWQFFGMVLVLLFLAGWPWHEPEPPNRVPREATRNRKARVSSSGAVAVLVVGSLVVLAIAPIWIEATAAHAKSSEAGKVLPLPETLGNLHRTGVTSMESGPGTVFRRADSYARVRYGSGHTVVLVNVAVYEGVPGEKNELVNLGNRVFDPSVWVTADSQKTNVSVPADFNVVYLTSRTGKARWLVWYMYRSGSHATASTVMVKFWQAWNRLLGHPARAAVVTLASPVTDGTRADAAARMSRVANDLLPWLQQQRSDRGS